MTDEVVALVLAGHRPNAGHGGAEWFDVWMNIGPRSTRQSLSFCKRAVLRLSQGRALACLGFARVAFRDGEVDAGLNYADEADRYAVMAGDEALQSTALHIRGEILRAKRCYAEAVPLYERLLEIDARNEDRRSLAIEHSNLGRCCSRSATWTRQGCTSRSRCAGPRWTS